MEKIKLSRKIWSLIKHFCAKQAWPYLQQSLGAVYICAIGIYIYVMLLLVFLVTVKSATAFLIFAFVQLGIAFVVPYLSLGCNSTYWSTEKGKRLPKAIRLDKALRVLHSTSNATHLPTLKLYGIRVFRAKTLLSEELNLDVHCDELKEFSSFFYFEGERNAAILSPYFCCDDAQIQEIIATLKKRWGGEDKQSIAITDTAYQSEIVTLKEKNAKLQGNFNALSARYARLEKEIDSAQAHMSTLIRLALHVQEKFSSTRTITEAQVKEKYLYYGKSFGLKDVPQAYITLFRDVMPQEYIRRSKSASNDIKLGKSVSK